MMDGSWYSSLGMKLTTQTAAGAEDKKTWIFTFSPPIRPLGVEHNLLSTETTLPYLCLLSYVGVIPVIRPPAAF
jgi:hypothetical protein